MAEFKRAVGRSTCASIGPRRWPRCGGRPRAAADQAHRIVQDEATAEAAWVHAYLHRVEGDTGNAGYWYRRAGRPVAAGPLETEWERMVSSLLGAGRA